VKGASGGALMTDEERKRNGAGLTRRHAEGGRWEAW
jgi:hypothetical protein